jgi:hypothetical protein
VQGEGEGSRPTLHALLSKWALMQGYAGLFAALSEFESLRATQ